MSGPVHAHAGRDQKDRHQDHQARQVRQDKHNQEHKDRDQRERERDYRDQRPQRPTLKKHHASSTRVVSTRKRDSRQLGAAATASIESDADDDAAALLAPGMAFLQYCATCEKQIQVPNNAVLYCSEACRLQDTHSSASSYRIFDRDERAPLTLRAAAAAKHAWPAARDIVPQLSPTILPGHQHDPFGPASSASDSDTASVASEPASRRPSTPGLSYSAASSKSPSPEDAQSPSTPPSYYTPRPRYAKWGSTAGVHSTDLVTPVHAHVEAPLKTAKAKAVQSPCKCKTSGPASTAAQPLPAPSLSYEKKKRPTSRSDAQFTGPGSLQQLFFDFKV